MTSTRSSLLAVALFSAALGLAPKPAAAVDAAAAQELMKTKDQITGALTASNSRRPVSGVSVTLSQANGAALGSVSAENLYTSSNPGAFVFATTAQMLPDPSANSSWTGSAIETTLNFVGRNHKSP